MKNEANIKYIYQRDGGGNLMAIYKQEQEGNTTYCNTYLIKNPIYGSGRVGMVNYEKSRLIKSEVISGGGNPQPTYEIAHFERERGLRQYKISNHLGNVLAVVTDVVIGQGSDEAEYYMATVLIAVQMRILFFGRYLNPFKS